MLTVVGMGLAWLALMFIAGLPLASWVSTRILPSEKLNFSLILALSIVFGFFYSSLAAGWSYGLLGIDTYPLVLLTLIIFSWLMVLFTKKIEIIGLIFKFIKLKDWPLLIAPILAALLTKPQYESLLRPSMRAGYGPDTPQNIMAALSARSLGSNWFDQANNLNNFFGLNSLRETIYNIFQYPSFRDQAGFDYLVYGTRWGLTIPYSQVIKYFGNSAALWETGITLFVGLTVIGLITYAVSALINTKTLMKNSVLIFSMCSAPFLFQVFNGGMSQSWAAVGIVGLLLAIFGIFMPIIESKYTKQEFIGWTILFTATFSILFSTYVDALIILGIFIIILTLLAATFDKARAIFMVKIVGTSAIATLIISPILTLATLYTFDFRLRAAQGTGAPTKIWPLPSELLGLVNVFSPDQISRSPETLLIAILLSSFIIYSILKLFKSSSSLDKSVAILGSTGLGMMFLGFLLSITGQLGNNYIYLKVSQYVSYAVVISFAYSLFPTKLAEQKRKSNRDSLGVVLVAYVILAASTSIVTTWDLSKSGTNIPSGFGKIMDDSSVQKELSDYNYLATYTTSTNIFGILGNVHWISKAPNDQVLKSRRDKELRLICFAQDTSCKPTSAQIPSPVLNQYGILVHQSPITTSEFEKLTVKDRYDINFIVFGQEPQQVPSQYMGGNPYFQANA